MILNNLTSKDYLWEECTQNDLTFEVVKFCEYCSIHPIYRFTEFVHSICFGSWILWGDVWSLHMRWVSDFNPNPMERSWVHLRRSRIGLLLGSCWIAGRVWKRFRFQGPPSTSYFNGFTPSHLGPRYYSCHIYMNQRVRFLGYLRCLKGRFSKWTRAEMSEHVPRHGFHPRVCCIWGNYNHFQTSSTTKWWRHSCSPSKLRNGLRMVGDFVRFTHVIQVNLQTLKNCKIK